MAQALVNAGAHVSLWGRSRSRPIADVAEEIAEVTGCRDSVYSRTVDAGEEAALQEALIKTTEEMGSPTCLINGVGGNRGKSSFNDADIETFREVLDMNIFAGLVLPTRVVSRFWIEKKQKGSIINIASMASYIPLSGVWAYGAAKSGVMNLTMAAAREFAPYGIRVNGIAPGFFIGDQNRRLLIADDKTGELTERGKAVIEHTPFGRFGEAEELGGVTVFLVSDRASGFITGTTIPVDGGYLVHNI
jgi:NAD(P)-dependent dehydrogenase (short-subunit alcohol dehydrogenase family)